MRCTISTGWCWTLTGKPPDDDSLLYAAMEGCAGGHRDYKPPSGASQQFVRNHVDWTVAAGRYRYPL